MNKAVEKLKEEVLAVLPPTIFFFVALHIVGLVRVLMTKGTGLPITSSAQIALAALIIGKAVLLADLWPPINRFPEKPLIYNIGCGVPTSGFFACERLQRVVHAHPLAHAERRLYGLHRPFYASMTSVRWAAAVRIGTAEVSDGLYR